MGTATAIIQGTIWVLLVAVLIYLIFRRIRIKEAEDFEKRDN